MAKRLTQGINVERLDQLVKDLGVRVRLFKSTICPNVQSLESVDHNVNCKICNNNMIDFAPNETTALFQQQDLVEQFKIQGTFHVDQVLVTFLSGETLFPYAKLELLDFKEDFTELVVRQEATDIDRLKYSACDVLGLFTKKNNTEKEEFHFGTDFVLDVNGDVKWIGAHKPVDRQVYTIYYRFHPVFRAIQAVHRDRYSQYNLRPDKIQSEKTQISDRTYIKLPETWVVKRDYLLERRDHNKAILPRNEDYDPNT